MHDFSARYQLIIFGVYSSRELVSEQYAMDVEDIGAVLIELRAFWTYLQREHHLLNARRYLRVLNRRTAQHVAAAVGGYRLDLDDELEWEVNEGWDEGLESQWVERLLETVLQLWGRLRKHFRMPR